MINNKKVIVIMPAYNAEKTLEKVYREIYRDVVDEIILVDDFSKDKTKEIAKELKITTILHQKNRGYGGNQKSCYTAALKAGADIVIMVHPDYQYSPKLIPAVAAMIAFDEYDCVIGSRMLAASALKGGMPVYKFISNRFLTIFQNLLTWKKLSEYHTGFRGFSRKVLESLPLKECSDDFIFDNEILAQIYYFGYSIGEISCPTKYFKEASSINFRRSLKYGLNVLRISSLYLFARCKLCVPHIFKKDGQRLNQDDELIYYYKNSDEEN
ncbi:MAG: glycosyltransferase family 2 protein [Candidatus Portnoybacteria bacterium]|nr:glycosyltransferase family 2 protein [Candidatus Portnoybacteria bacterium]